MFVQEARVDLPTRSLPSKLIKTIQDENNLLKHFEDENRNEFWDDEEGSIKSHESELHSKFKKNSQKNPEKQANETKAICDKSQLPVEYWKQRYPTYSRHGQS